jgi:hypothetical protein
MPTPTATIFVPYHALDEALPATVARTDAPNTFTADQTIDADLYVTGEVNPARRSAQRPKIDQLIGPGSGRTLLSNDLTAGMSLRYDLAAAAGKVTVGNYDTQTYQPLALEADHIALTTGTFPPGMEEHVRVHSSGGVTVGEGATHDTDPGVGVLVATTAQFTAGLPSAQVRASAASRVLGRGASGPGPVEELTLGTGLVIEGTTLRATAQDSGYFGYGFSTQTTEPPSAQTARLNAGHPYTAATKLWVTFQNANSEDLYFLWMRTTVGSTVLVQDKDHHPQYAEFTVTAAVLDKGTYCEIPVSWHANGTALATQACLVRTTEPVVGAALETRLAALEARVAALEGA